MIKLIVTDVDGTLIKESSSSINPDYCTEIRRLTDKGYVFVVASGRQYQSLARLFEPVLDCIYIAAENGSHIRYMDKDLKVIPMNQDIARDIIRDIRQRKDTEFVVSYPCLQQMESQNQEFIDWFVEGYHSNLNIVKDVLDCDIPIIKVAAYKKAGMREEADSFYLPKWGDKCLAVMGGVEWLDFMDFSAGKGTAIRFLQEYHNISKEETMVFGDNQNDIGMLMEASESYVVENAHPDVKAYAKNICKGYQKDGVLSILRTL